MWSREYLMTIAWYVRLEYGTRGSLKKCEPGLISVQVYLSNVSRYTVTVRCIQLARQRTWWRKSKVIFFVHDIVLTPQLDS